MGQVTSLLSREKDAMKRVPPGPSPAADFIGVTLSRSTGEGFHYCEIAKDVDSPLSHSVGEGQGVSNCVRSQVVCANEFSHFLIVSLVMAFKITSSFRMQAVMATLKGLPALSKRS